ncbi:MAG TPA: sigma-54 dependent transcriptional regulator [Acidobacteriaceae bacterium]|nr:sigma-54 dependent transcriptional regulator [Acidobacteriaceae bacterium]
MRSISVPILSGPLGSPAAALTDAALYGITRALASVGRAFICLDPELTILHASPLLDRFLGEGASRAVCGRPVEELLGAELFGARGPLRQALLDGQMREGWRATLKFNDSAPRLVSITTAPLISDSSEICDPKVRYLILLRPADEEVSCSTAPVYYSGAIACSPAMQRIFRMVETLQHSEATVLITGESGTGKEVVARAVHQSSVRSSGPFVAVNCGALPADLLESELFGHVRGAFTGAIRDRVGRFELASHGTLFLDEIGDLPPALQVKLLRVLQERQYQRVGESATRTTHARIIAATNVDLRGALRRGRLREDLYYRLCVVPIEVPPLRDRREDIPPLTLSLLNRITAQHGLVRRVSPQAMRMLLDHSWPGNVRELANVIEYAVAVARMETILPEDLPEEIKRPANLAEAPPAHSEDQPLVTNPVNGSGVDLDAARLRSVLEAHQWKRAKAAEALGISRATLWRRMRELHLG